MPLSVRMNAASVVVDGDTTKLLDAASYYKKHKADGMKKKLRTKIGASDDEVSKLLAFAADPDGDVVLVRDVMMSK